MYIITLDLRSDQQTRERVAKLDVKAGMKNKTKKQEQQKT